MKAPNKILIIFAAYLLILLLILLYIRKVTRFKVKQYFMPAETFPELGLLKLSGGPNKAPSERIVLQLTDDEEIKEINRSYAAAHQMDYLSLPPTQDPLKVINNLLHATEYEFVIYLSEPMVVVDFDKKFDRILHQAGDSDLILARDRAKKVSLDVMVMRNSDWVKNKIGQISYYGGSQAGILDPISIDCTGKFTGKFTEFKEIENGLPFFTYNICVFNEHAFNSGNSSFIVNSDQITGRPAFIKQCYEGLQKEKKVSPAELNYQKIEIYPWKGISGFREVEKGLDKLPSLKEGSDSKEIPKYIFQTMKTNLLPDHVVEKLIDPLRKLNPGYQYFYFDNLDCRNFIKDNFPSHIYKSYLKLIPGAYKADFWRYCVLYLHGGCYLDVRLLPLYGLDEIIGAYNFVVPRDMSSRALWQAVLFSYPKNPVIRGSINRAHQNILGERSDLHALEITGPVCIGKVFSDFIGERDIKSGPGSQGDVKYKILSFDGASVRDGNKVVIICRFHPRLKFLLQKERAWYHITGTCHYGALSDRGQLWEKASPKTMIN